MLHDVNLDLRAHSIVAIVGVNGAGKSSLIKLLCGFYRPTTGQITVDDIPLADIDLTAWRQRLSGSFQDFARFELPVRETVGVGDLSHVDDRDAVASAIARAGAADVVDQLPDGLETQLGRVFDGVELSGGQWQKLALARASMRSLPLLLILDEPTAALDARTEHAVFERYAARAEAVDVAGGAITILVSHRFSTVRMADHIIVVDNGRIVQQGTHDELMRAGGSYAELYQAQANAYQRDL